MNIHPNTLTRRLMAGALFLSLPTALLAQGETGDTLRRFHAVGNPVITHEYTCDPATLVKGDTLWLYTGHDAAGGQKGYNLKDWRVFSTTDLTHWTEYPTPLRVADFKWDRSGAAYAGHCIKRDGKYYFYISTNGSGIGVAVADRPEGPFRDAIGRPLLTNADCAGATHSWVCIDPAVFIDDDGQAWLFWGNRFCYAVRLKRNMVETEGDIVRIDIPGSNYTEAPWVHKKDGKYYLTFARDFPEKLAYAMADKVDGPYEYKGLLTEVAGNSNTIHPAITKFRGQWVLFYHNGGIAPDGGSYSRSVYADYLHYRSDGTMQRVEMTTEGVDREYVPFDNRNNPVLRGCYAGPEVMYSKQTGRYYIYPTSDGFDGWGGYYFKAFSSPDLRHWTDEGQLLNLRTDIRWADTDIRTMEDYDQGYGSIIYRTTLPDLPNGGKLRVDEAHDYAQVFIDGTYVGKLDRRNGEKELSLPAARKGAQLNILVEAMGRVNFGRAIKDYKGITHNVQLTLDHEGYTFSCDLKNWQVFNIHDTYDTYRQMHFKPLRSVTDAKGQRQPGVYRGTFRMTKPADTFLNFETWGKGLVYVNGIALGRIWEIGPQQTLYVPGCWLRKGENEVMVFDVVGPTKAQSEGLAAPLLDQLQVKKPLVHQEKEALDRFKGAQPVATGAFKAGNGWQEVKFGRKATGRYLCLRPSTPSTARSWPA